MILNNTLKKIRKLYYTKKNVSIVFLIQIKKDYFSLNSMPFFEKLLFLKYSTNYDNVKYKHQKEKKCYV